MDNKSKLNLITVILTGLCGLLGVIVGAGITGYYSLKNQQIISEQQKLMFSRQTAQMERQELKNIFADYTDVVTDYYDLITSEKVKTTDVDKFSKKAFRASFQITLIISIDLGQKTFELNEIFMKNLHAKTQRKYLPEMENEVIKKFVEWIVIAKGELKLLEYTATPENITTDLIRLFLRGAMQKKEEITAPNNRPKD